MNIQSGSAISAEAQILSEYIAGAAERELPPSVAEKTRHHLLDTIAAIISGSRLRAGKLAAAYVARLAASEEATVIGTLLAVPAEFAALANGMAAHADETDDSHLGGRFHPGCGIVPAALAVAEARDRGGGALIGAIALGYDVGARLNMALGYTDPNNRPGHSTHSLGTAFGAAAAAAALLRLDARQVRHVLSYAAQQASGVPYWHRDAEHVEKAFDFGGMGARNGVAAALMVEAGFSGVDDAFSGRNHFFTAFGEKPASAELGRDLGSRFEIMAASVKKWCVGSPIQSVLDATSALIEQHRIGPKDVRAVRITMPHDRMHIVDDRAMPDVCVQHLAAVAILDGTVSFAAAHDRERMHDAAVQAVRSRITLIPSPELSAAVPARQAIVEIDLANGATVRRHAKAVRGTPDNPMTAQEIEAKALDLMSPVIGTSKAEELVAYIRQIEGVRSLRELRPLLRHAA
jgi:2-methylcitrate dehydratase PrpD